MKIVFVVRDPVPKLAVTCLSAYLKRAGHECGIVFALDEPDVVAAVKRQGGGLVAFTATSGRHNWTIDVARRLKEKLDVFTIVGGAHPTYFPSIAEVDGLDACCIGEGEGALLELADRLDRGEPVRDIANLWVKEDGVLHKNPVRPLIADLDTLPIDDRDLYMDVPYIREYQRDTFIYMTSRGCPYNCTFCYNRAARSLYQGKGQFVRRKSVDKAIDELQHARDRYRLNGVIFEDDTFTLDEAWVLEFLRRYSREVGVPFIINARGDQVTAEIARALASAGCRGVKLGVETGNEELREKVLKKPVTNAEFIRSAEYLKKEGIKIQCFNILGIPGGSLEKDLETLDFVIKLGADHPWCSVMNPYPQTEIREIAIAEGVLDGCSTVEDFQRESYFVDTALNIPDKREVVNLHHFFGIAARFPMLIPAVKLAIPLPLTPVYERLFKLHHIDSLRRFYRIRTVHWLRFLWHCRGIY